MIYIQLLLSFMKIGLFGFGGGLAILSLIQREVEVHGWMSQQEFVDIVAISQVTPGPIGINCATYVGYTATGCILGSVIATVAIILPSLVIMLSLCKLYLHLRNHYRDNRFYQLSLSNLRFAVLGLIAAAALCLMTPANFIDYCSWIIFAVTAIFMLLPAVSQNRVTATLSHPILLLILSGIIGYLLYA